uniref:Uncharacterized protein n=1 Tax=Arundo donax TaxID=35708 RepID=A0A0A8ZD19_ARUDO
MSEYMINIALHLSFCGMCFSIIDMCEVTCLLLFSSSISSISRVCLRYHLFPNVSFSFCTCF